MKIRMLAGVAGTDFVLNRGEVTERYSIAEAQRLIKAGLAESATDEQADRQAVEIAQFKIEVDELNKQIAARDAQLLDAARLQTGSDDLRKKVTALEAERDAKSVDAARLQAENDELRKQVAALHAERAAAALQQVTGETDGTGTAGAGG